MVQILVKVNDSSESIKEWVLIEVQGDIECDSESSVGGKIVGQLLFPSKEKPILIIGYHILYGKIIENEPNIAVLEKSRVKSPSVPVSTENLTTYTLLALVKKRIVFRTRPKPIVTPE